MYNSTLTSSSYAIYGLTGGGCDFYFYNCSIRTTAASRYCISGTYDSVFTAIDCNFISLTDNYLAAAVSMSTFTFASCLYQGLPIEANDFVATTCDYDIRIYEKNIVTILNNVPNAGFIPSHPYLENYGLVYDNINYLKIPGYLLGNYTNATGVGDIYLLKRSAYWRSGLASASRTWIYWSDSV
jgi:hypothetical protein